MEGSFPMAGSQMEVDLPSTSGSTGSNLKRSNSAPMINALPPNTPTEAVQETHRSHTPSLTLSIPQPRPLDSARVRRFSSSSVALTSIHATTSTPLNTTPIKTPSRLLQIKNEEKLNLGNREAAHEKEIQSAMQISHSWDEFRLDDNNEETPPVHQPPLQETAVSNMHNVPLHVGTNMPDMPMAITMEPSCSNSLGPMKRQRSYSETLLFPLSGSPSPTRVGKQCYSPSMQAPVRNSTLTPSPSPSPTRKTFARSLSPIAMKPSTLCMKRKLDCDNEGLSSYMSPPKRFSTGASTPDRQLAPHPLTHSISSSSLEDNSSPEQIVPRGATTTTCTIRNMQTHRSPCYTFTPVSVTEANDNVIMTDSETSEVTDISDSSMTHMQMSPVRHGHT